MDDTVIPFQKPRPGGHKKRRGDAPQAPLSRAAQIEVERQAEVAAIAAMKAVRAAERRVKRYAPNRKCWRPNLRERHQVKLAAASGLGVAAIAAIMGVSDKVLRKHCAGELENGANEVNAKVAAKLFGKCMKGDTIALIYWTKTRLGWREANRVEHTGKDGGPIQHQTVTAEADAFKARIEELAKRHAALPAKAANDKSEAPAEKPEGEAAC